jgi:metal-sulfur cluster biosynthetic enzyme
MSTGLDLSSKEAEIRFALRGVTDPEIGLSVVDVGLIYDICVGEDGTAVITMTTTTRGCPATQYLVEAVRERALDTGRRTKSRSDLHTIRHGRRR